jgi:site-specific DNA-methyltransferase (adenine-specific)
MNTIMPKKFEKDGQIIYWGDCLKVLPEIPDRSIDLVFADPPYNIGKRFSDFVDQWPSDEAYADWCKEWLDLCLAKLKDTGSMYIMCSTQCMPYLDLYLRRHAHILSRIVWHYDSSGVQARKRYGSLYEPILFCVKDSDRYTFNAESILVEARTGAQRKLIDYRKPTPAPYNAKKVPGNVWSIPRVRYRMDEYEEHPSQKPEALLERIVLASSNPGETILDPFSGTFTTSMVANRLGRKSIGIELQEAYVRIGLRRLGLAKSLNGVKLEPLEKTYVRVNSAQKTSLFVE